VSDAVSSAVELASASLADITVLPMLSENSVPLSGHDPDPLAVSPLTTSVTPAGGSAQPVLVYNPSQIRAAYQLPALPALGTSLNATQRANLGAGQTIYVIAAKHDPKIVNELAAFNTKFQLPPCSTVTIAATQSLPLPAASNSSCEFAVVYSSGTGMTSTAPTYDSNWAQEIALDVQWAHATAPLARIILIEASDASTASMLNAVNLANAMGPGVVSMSFGAAEGDWVTSMDSAFSSANMTYVAATGDSGTSSGAQWPSVSPRVLAVGGTRLNSYTATSRSESVWSSTGGNRSQFVSVPAYQTASVPGLGSQSYRSVADVAFNADPYTGQYVAIIDPASNALGWYSMGGTSLGTPQWAGIVAVANAQRALNASGSVGLVQNLIYPASSANGFYTGLSNLFADIISGASDAIAAGTGYDIPSGLGTPNVQSFLTLATNGSGGLNNGGATPPSLANNLSINGVAGTALAFSVSYTAPNPVTWSVTGAPAGLSIAASTGLVSWSNPGAGNYIVTVRATDTVTSLWGETSVNINIAAPSAPVIQNATIQGNVGTPLTYRVPVASRHPVTYALGGTVPAGVTISSRGVVSWAAPTLGTYPVTVTVTDAVTNASASATLTLQINAALIYTGPVISASAINGTAGSALAALINITDTDPGVRSISVGIKGAPAGMSFGGSGQGILVRWQRPVAGTYTLVITATDNLRRSSQSSVTVTIR
jgi:subtilase family serine protease